jgi:Protein of unknown function (DUF2971)
VFRRMRLGSTHHMPELVTMVRDISMNPDAIPLAPGEPKMVYQYTGTKGLIGIVTNKVLWASDVWFMNDAREALYGLDVIEHSLESLDIPTDTGAEVRRRALGLIQSIRDQQEFWPSYIACLSSIGDDLSQWRAYGRPRGFSIGFDTAQLRGLCADSPEFDKPTFRYVEYDERRQAGTIAIIFNTPVNALPAAPTGDQLQAAALAFMNAALALAPALKHPAFSSEREIRLHVYRQASATDGLLFRPGAMGIVPYVEIDLKDPGTNKMTLIREVIIGPQSNELESQRSVKQFLAHHGLHDVEVQLSKVPLRSA